jgi:hypothetical protein
MRAFLFIVLVLAGCGPNGPREVRETSTVQVEAPSTPHHTTPVIVEGHDYLRLHFTKNGNEYHDDPVIHSPSCGACQKERDEKFSASSPRTVRGIGDY